jgi:hypothetical protein
VAGNSRLLLVPHIAVVGDVDNPFGGMHDASDAEMRKLVRPSQLLMIQTHIVSVTSSN